ncbi:MAG: PD40 domain-containing protein [candidate division Zixibacteria bacterium]|nr:PD40 domain-containing protein [candidate division Zixibacteria bacterium]
MKSETPRWTNLNACIVTLMLAFLLLMPGDSSGQEPNWNQYTTIGSPVRLTLDLADDTEPSWSPDGTMIAFVSDRTGNDEIWRIDLATGTVDSVTSNGNTNWHLDWSPDGQLISYNGGPNTGEIWVVAPDGSGDTARITPGPCRHPDWSPEGSEFLYTARIGVEGPIHRINSDGSGEPIVVVSSGWYPDWSPDGSRIAFARYYGGGQIYLVDPDGSNLKNISTSSDYHAYAAWSPDGSKIACSITKNGNSEIYIIDTLGNELLQVTNNPSSDGYPTWSPSGDAIAFHSNREGNADIWMVEFVSNSLLIPSVSVLPCDAQPVVVDVHDSIQAIALPIAKEYGVSIRDWSMIGLPTENWYVTFEEQTDSSFFIHFQDVSGGGLPPGQHTVLNLYVQPECTTSTFIYWDTAFSDDSFRTLAFTDMQYQTIYPAFVPDPNPTEILGYVPGDVDGTGGVDISDLVYTVDYMFTGGPPPCVMDALDVNGDCKLDISDLVYFVDYMFQGGLELQCGCVSSGVAAKVVAHPRIVVTAKVDDGMTTISLAAPFDLRGLDLQLVGPDGARPVKLAGDDLDMVFGQDGQRVKIGIIDLDGANVISAGDNRVIQIAGEYEVVSAVVATDGYHTYAATIGEAAKGGSLPTEFSLSQNYPNPFNPVTTISFSLPVVSHVTLEVYNVMGQRVTTVADGFYEAGVHACEWDGSSVASGVYFYRIETDAYTETKKMMLLK